MKTQAPFANPPHSRAQRIADDGRAGAGRSPSLSTPFVFLALAGALATAFTGGWLLRGRQHARAQAHASPVACLAQQLDERESMEGTDLPAPRLTRNSLPIPAPVVSEGETMPEPIKLGRSTESPPPPAPIPDLTPRPPLPAHEIAALSQKEREAVIGQAQLEATQIGVLDERIRKLNDQIEDWLTDYETNLGQTPGDRQAASSRDFMLAVLAYVNQAQGELTAQLGDRFAAAAQAVDFDLSSQIDSHLIERLASVARPRT